MYYYLQNEETNECKIISEVHILKDNDFLRVPEYEDYLIIREYNGKSFIDLYRINRFSYWNNIEPVIKYSNYDRVYLIKIKDSEGNIYYYYYHYYQHEG